MDGFFLLKSRKQYDELDDFLLKVVRNENYKSLMIDSFIIIDGSLRCSDGRTFGKEGKKNPMLLMNSNGKEVVDKMIEEGFADSDSVISLDDLHKDELTKDENVVLEIKKVKYIKNSKDFEKYLDIFFT